MEGRRCVNATGHRYLQMTAAGPGPSPAWLSVFTGVPQAQQVDSRIHYLVTHLVMADLNSTHIPWLELFQAFTNAWVGQQCDRGRRELLHCSCGGRLIHRRQKLVQPGNVGKRLACPLQLDRKSVV